MLAWRLAGTPEATAPTAGRRGSMFTDIGIAAGASAVIAVAKPDLRRALARDASFSHVLENFVHPIRQIRRGTKRDTDPFWVNDVAHPGLFALEALYLKRRGYGDGGAFLFTQVHSVVWEFVIEGSAFEPSGKDLVADAAGAALGIWVLRPVAARATQRIAAGRGRWCDHVARWLDPVTAVSGPRRGPTVSFQPALSPSGFGLEIAATF